MEKGVIGSVIGLSLLGNHRVFSIFQICVEFPIKIKSSDVFHESK